MKLLLVEDEEQLAILVAKGLKKSRYAVDIAADGAEALYNISINEYDLIILDLNLPEIDGLSVLRELRKSDAQTKVLILTARSRIDERVEGLDRGANDYLCKPFDFKELDARVRSLLRMSYIMPTSELICGGIIIDTVKKSVMCNGVKLPLTKKEYGILEYLAANMGAVISAEQLVEHVWDSEADLFSNSLKFHIHSLKKKIATADDTREYIKNIRAQGYILENADENI